MTSHSEELSPKKLRMCNKCGKPFKSRCGLKLHMQTHDSEDMLNSCTFCDFKTPQKANLIKHLAVKHKKDNQVINFEHNGTNLTRVYCIFVFCTTNCIPRSRHYNPLLIRNRS